MTVLLPGHHGFGCFCQGRWVLGSGKNLIKSAAFLKAGCSILRNSMARRKSNRWQARVGSFKHQPRPKVKEGFSSSALVEAFFHRKLSCACAMILLLSLVFLTYLRALTSDFITYDDQVYVTGNYHVQRGLTWEGVKWAFYTSTAANWHPLTWMSHMLDCTLFGLNAWGHCHRAEQNQPEVSDSKPATLKCGIHIISGFSIKGFLLRVKTSRTGQRAF